MLTQDSKYNYMKIELEDLPSRGLAYPEGTVIKGRFLTIQDVKFLALLNEYTATSVINEILDRCFYMTFPFEDLLLCDRLYLAFWLRANSFMKENGYTFNIKCQNCGSTFTQKLLLDDIPVLQLQSVPTEVILPKSRHVLSLKMPTIKDLNTVYEDRDIEYIARMLRVENPVDYVLNLNAYDYAYLSAICSQYNAGFNLTFDFPCKNCGKMNHMQLVLTDDGLFGQMNIRNIINVVLRVTKYVGCYIPDTTPWPELEMIQDVTNAMVKEENEEIQKQEAKAKAQQASMQSKYSSKYHTH